MRALGVVMIEWALLIVSSCFYFARLYVRVIQLDRPLKVAGHWRWSDIFITLAWVVMLAEAIIDSFLAHLNFPSMNIPRVRYSPDVVVLINKITVFESAIYWWPLNFVKLAMICFYKEFIFSTVFPRLSRFIKTLGFLIFCNLIVSTVVLLCFCLPITKRWSLDRKVWLTCQSKRLVFPLYLCFPLFEVVTDLFVLVIPFLVLSKMQNLPIRQKIGVCAMFSLGGLSLACSATYMYFELGIVLAVGGASNNTFLSIFVAMTAQNTAVMVACMPALRKLFVSRASGRRSGISTQEVVQPKPETETTFDSNGSTAVQTDSVVGVPFVSNSSRDVCCQTNFAV